MNFNSFSSLLAPTVYFLDVPDQLAWLDGDDTNAARRMCSKSMNRRVQLTAGIQILLNVRGAVVHSAVFLLAE